MSSEKESTMPILNDMISKFDKQSKRHLEAQSLNPFSGGFSRSPSPRPGDDDYGKPIAGSKTEERGMRAKSHISREILELCEAIYDLGMYNKELNRRRKEMNPGIDLHLEDEEDEDGNIIVTFGELFEMYTRINDKVVGLLIAAKKKKFVYFEKEILFQRRDDDVLIALIKPINEIKAILKDAISPAPTPIPDRGNEQTIS